MKITEGKQAVLRSYKEGQYLQPKQAEPLRCLAPEAYTGQTLSAAQCIPKTVYTAKMRVPSDCVPIEVSPDSSVRFADCVRDTAPVTVPQELQPEQVTARTPVTNQVQPVSATPELGEMLDETASGLSGMEKKKWFAEAVLHMAHR